MWTGLLLLDRAAEERKELSAHVQKPHQALQRDQRAKATPSSDSADASWRAAGPVLFLSAPGSAAGTQAGQAPGLVCPGGAVCGAGGCGTGTEAAVSDEEAWLVSPSLRPLLSTPAQARPAATQREAQA